MTCRCQICYVLGIQALFIKFTPNFHDFSIFFVGFPIMVPTKSMNSYNSAATWNFLELLGHWRWTLFGRGRHLLQAIKPSQPVERPRVPRRPGSDTNVEETGRKDMMTSWWHDLRNEEMLCPYLSICVIANQSNHLKSSPSGQISCHAYLSSQSSHTE